MALKLSDLSRELDAAIDSVESRQAAVVAAKKVLVDAEEACSAVTGRIKELHKQYEAIITNFLTAGGTIHR